MPQFHSQVARALYDEFASLIEQAPQIARQDKLRLLVLHVSEGCNLGCTYCFADKGQYGKPSKKFMSPEVAVNAVAAALQSYGQLDQIKFFGGEPFLNLPALEAVQEFLETHQTAHGSNIPKITVISNMTIASTRALNWIHRAKPTITGSVDGPEMMHNKFRIFPEGKGSFKIVDANTKTMLESCGQPSALECVYTPHHFAAGMSIADVHQWIVDRYGVLDVLVHPMGLIGDAKSVITEDQWLAYSSALYEMAVDYGDFLIGRKYAVNHPAKIFIQEVFWRNQTDAHCDLGVNNLTVNASGRIYPCYTLLDDETQDMGGIDEIKRGGDFLRVQRSFLEMKKDGIHECRSCDIRLSCHSCPGEMRALEGNMASPSRNSCNFMTGVVEGSLLAINRLRNDSLKWSEFVTSAGIIETT